MKGSWLLLLTVLLIVVTLGVGGCFPSKMEVEESILSPDGAYEAKMLVITWPTIAIMDPRPPSISKYLLIKSPRWKWWWLADTTLYKIVGWSPQGNELLYERHAYSSQPVFCIYRHPFRKTLFTSYSDDIPFWIPEEGVVLIASKEKALERFNYKEGASQTIFPQEAHPMGKDALFRLERLAYAPTTKRVACVIDQAFYPATTRHRLLAFTTLEGKNPSSLWLDGLTHWQSWWKDLNVSWNQEGTILAIQATIEANFPFHHSFQHAYHVGFDEEGKPCFLPPEDLTQAAIANLQSPHEEERKSAICVLGNLRASEAIPFLKAMASSEPSLEVSLLSLWALVGMKEPLAMDMAISSLDKLGRFQPIIIEALVEAGELRLVPHLKKAAREGGWFSKNTYLEMLGRLGDGWALEQLALGLKTERKHEALESLTQIDSPRAGHIVAEELVSSLREPKEESLPWIASGAEAVEKAEEPSLCEPIGEALLKLLEAHQNMKEVSYETKSKIEKTENSLLLLLLKSGCPKALGLLEETAKVNPREGDAKDPRRIHGAVLQWGQMKGISAEASDPIVMRRLYLGYIQRVFFKGPVSKDSQEELRHYIIKTLQRYPSESLLRREAMVTLMVGLFQPLENHPDGGLLGLRDMEELARLCGDSPEIGASKSYFLYLLDREKEARQELLSAMKADAEKAEATFEELEKLSAEALRPLPRFSDFDKWRKGTIKPT